VDGSFHFLDLGSSNGTKVNGSPATEGELSDGDQITIGTTTMTFEIGEEDRPQPHDRTMFLQTVLDETGTEAESPPATREQELLEAAYTLMNALASNFNPCDLVDRVLHTTMEAIDGQRGAVLFAGADGEMLPCSDCGHVHVVRGGRSEHASVDEIAISESVARRVLRDGESVRYRSGWADSGVDLSHSIAQLKLSSIICAPIRAQNQIFGILYIDTDVAEQTYSNDDLLLATAAGNSAGLAFLNARNHRAMLEKQRIEQDIEAAWSIQEGFLVRDWPDDDRRIEVYGETQPAKVVGGDFYDYVMLDQDRVGLLIGDVSGKGIPAALTMAQLLAEFRLHAHEIRSPAEILNRLNELFVVRSQRGAFCTMAYFEVDLASGRAVGASAGHHPALVASADGVRQILPGSGPPVGVLPNLAWQNEEFVLAPGDTVVMYTDGIAEAKATATVTPSTEGGENEFGLERLEHCVRRLARENPRALIAEVIAEVRRFTAPLAPHDDCTMIAMRYLHNDA
jgi:sigma-B regulation protein RsbU (phosphoserine phosphatase)